MPRVLDITGEYPADWQQISNDVWAAAGHRCIRCGHPYQKGTHGKGEWTPCDHLCRHQGPLGVLLIETIAPISEESSRGHTGGLICGKQVFAQWRIGTVHHLDGNKANCVWWNLLALCQRCHLTIQARVNPQQPYMLEHTAWFKPYVAAFYAHKYEGRTITREEAVADMDRLLAYERIA